MGSRPEPGLDIALDANGNTERLERCLKPPSQRQDKLVRRNLRAVGKAQLEAFVSRMPAFHRYAKAHFCAARLGQLQMRADGAFRVQHTAIGFEKRNFAFPQLKGRIARLNFSLAQ